MSTNWYSAGAGAIVAGAEASATARNEVQSSISAVDSSAQAVRGGWESPASRAMLETVARWRESAEAVNNELNNFESSKIQSSLDNLDSFIKKLCGSWDSQVQQAYPNSKAKWDQKMAGILEILQDLQGKVQDAGVQYQATESRNSSRFDEIGA